MVRSGGNARKGGKGGNEANQRMATRVGGTAQDHGDVLSRRMVLKNEGAEEIDSGYRLKSPSVWRDISQGYQQHEHRQTPKRKTKHVENSDRNREKVCTGVRRSTD